MPILTVESTEEIGKYVSCVGSFSLEWHQGAILNHFSPCSFDDSVEISPGSKTPVHVQRLPRVGQCVTDLRALTDNGGVAHSDFR